MYRRGKGAEIISKRLGCAAVLLDSMERLKSKLARKSQRAENIIQSERESFGRVVSKYRPRVDRCPIPEVWEDLNQWLKIRGRRFGL